MLARGCFFLFPRVGNRHACHGQFRGRPRRPGSGTRHSRQLAVHLAGSRGGSLPARYLFLHMSDDTFPSIGEIAGWVWGQDDAGLHRLEKTLDLLATAARRDEAPAVRTRVDRMGPWDIRTLPDGGVEWTVRAATTLRERHSWCLRPLSSKRAAGSLRVALLGSSAAASFGYWGDFTLANAIQRKLQAASPERPVEVFDLACVNATWGSILDTLRCAATLHP